MPDQQNQFNFKRLIALAGVALIVLAVIIFFGIRSNEAPPFELNRQGLLEFFEERINEIVPGDGWLVTRVRFAKERGIYVEYKNEDGRAQAFLLLVNPVSNERIDYEIIGVFNVMAEGNLELISGVDSFAGEKQEIWRLNRESGQWELAQ